ncbi:MAG: right-handed parallel beta-helix repeat-containing protein, partial [Cyanobacteria bacterium J06576_12]
MFRALSIDNLKIIGKGKGKRRATLKMNKSEYTQSEFGHILGIDGVKNFEIRGLKLTGAGGDGIHVAGAAFRTAKPGVRSYSENGVIEDIIANNNRRQGISIDSAKNVIVRDSVFSNTSGTAPSAGIDLEPTWDFERLQDIFIENVTVRGNDGNGIQLALGNLDNRSAPVSIDINNVKVKNNNRSGVTVVLFNSQPKDPFRDQPDGSKASSMLNGTVNIRNTTISRSKGTNTFFDQATAGIYVQSLSGSQEDPNNLKVNFQNVTVSNTGNGPFATNPIYIRGFGGELQPEQIGNLSFDNVVVKDKFERALIKAELGRPDAYLSNISGNIMGFNPKGVTTDFDFQTPAQNFSLTVKRKRNRSRNAAAIKAPSNTTSTPKEKQSIQNSSTYFVAPDGDDNNQGSINSPFATIKQAHDLAEAGDTIYMRGGRYKPPVDQITYLDKSGTADAPIKLFAYNDETPVIDGSEWTRRQTKPGGKAILWQRGDYWHVKGLEITNGPRSAYVAQSVKGSVWEDLNLHSNDNSGLNIFGRGVDL